MKNHYATRVQLKDRAKDLLNGSYGVYILGMFLFGLLLIALSLFTYLPITILSLEPEVPAWLTIAGTTADLILSDFTGFLQFGLASLSLKIVARQFRSFSDVFDGFAGANFRSVLWISLVRAAAGLICFLPANYCMNHLVQPEDLKTVLIYLILLLAGYLVYIPIILPLDVAYFLMLDFPDLSGWDLLAKSYSIMKGHTKRLFLLECSFIPLQILCTASLGIGFLWITPYMHMTIALFYLDLMSPSSGN